MSCAVCREALPEGARFCPNCGAAVATSLGTEERKVVTVLFADLVDSTGLAQRLDAERAREVLGRFFDAATEELQALRGRPEKFIGDAVMAVFGLPTVHEDDALRAVRAGIAIRERLRRLGDALALDEPLEVRVGIQSGEVATGQGPAGQSLVTGPVVNAAARLQAAADPGQVLVGETTYALTRAAVSFRARRDVRAKGFDRPLAAFPVEALTARSTRRTIPFVGRAAELALLRDGLSRATGTGQPILVTVLGEPGIGKSRLADEFTAGVGGDAIVLAGHTRSYTDTATFAPAAGVVGELAGFREDDQHAASRAKLRALVERACDPGDVERVLDRLSLLFGMTHGRTEWAFVSDVQAGFLALIDGVAKDRPVVLVFEDAHTLKAPMLDLIERLGAHARTGRRAVILVLARSELQEQRPVWGTTALDPVMVRLGLLTSGESIDLVRQAGGAGIDEAAASEIAARAGGNPFFIIETTGMFLPDGSGPSSSPVVIPPTVQAVISARIDALPERLRELARRAAAFLVSFDLDELAVADPSATVEDLRLLEDAEIVVREEGGPGPSRWRLRHAMLKDVAYASLPKRERVRLHRSIAERLATAGHHSWASDHLELAAFASLDLDRTDRAVSDEAADALVESGHRARRRMESRSAIDYYERALAISGPPPRWGVRESRALAGMGEAHYWLGEYPAATESLERAVALGTELDDPFTLALALRFMGDIAINVEADLDRAEALLDRSLIAAEELGDPWAIARTLLFAGWVPWTRERYEDAGAIWLRALSMADPDDGWARVRALNCLSINLTGGPERSGPAALAANEEALRLSDEASALAEEIGDQFSIAMTAVQRARVLGDLGRREEAMPSFDRAVAIFDDLGARWEYADAIAERGIAKRELDRLDEAEEDLLEATRISEELGERQLASWVWRALARVAERRGDHAEAGARHRRSKDAEERLRVRFRRR